MRADMHIDLSHDCMAHTLARLPDPCKSKSDLISPILACYDFFKINFFDDGRTVIGARKG